VGFLRRLLGRTDDESGDRGGASASEASRDGASDIVAMTADEEERAHELELARFEQDRTTDLVRRQQQYSNRSWTPPPQGGPKRAGDEEESA
jgi:hypothetical protein